MLPLRAERSPDERRIEAQTVLASLAQKLGVDKDKDGHAFSVSLDDAAKKLYVKRKAADPMAEGTWDDLTVCLFEFDAHIQDILSATSDTQANGYQLGRGLAEAYWALQPDRDGQTATPPLGTSPSPTSWSFLLGDERCGELKRLVARLSPYLNNLTPPAIAGSLVVWRGVAAEEDWRGQPAATDALYEQVRRWYELLVLNQDPVTLLKPYALIANPRVTWRTVKVLWPQLLLAAASLAAVLGLIVLLAHDSGSALLKGALGLVGVGGLSLAGLQTKLKNTAQLLLQRLRNDAYCDLVATAVSCPPPLPDRGFLRRSNTDRVVAKAVRQRGISSANSITASGESE